VRPDLFARTGLFLGSLVIGLMLQGCVTMVVGAVVGTAATVAIEAAKVPVKATGAAVDAVTGDDEEDEDGDE